MRHIKLKELSVAYQQKGKGPVLIFLHGFAIDSRIWKPQVDGLSKNFTVIAWDAPGAGQSSDPPEDFTIEDWADCLALFIDSLNIKKAHIAGLSWGGILAQVFYERHQDRITSLILADTYAGWKGSLPSPIPEQRLAGCLRDASLPPSEFVPKYLPGMFTDRVDDKVKNELAKIMAGFHPVGFRLMSLALAKLDTRDLLPKIIVPTLLIWGNEDKRSPASIAHQFHNSIPYARLAIIPDAGHVSNMEKPGEFNIIVEDFLSQQAKGIPIAIGRQKAKGN